MKARSALALALLLGGCDEPSQPPGTPLDDLEPIPRTSSLVWEVEDAESLAGPGAALLEVVRPSALLATGPSAPGLDDAAAEAVLDAAAAAGVRGAVAPPLLPAGLTEACFDPADPLGDPGLVAARDAFIAFLDRRPDASEVVLDPRLGARWWEVSCTCTACDDVGAVGQAQRAEMAWDLLAVEAAERGRAAWWWHDAAGEDPGADPVARASLDLAVEGLDERTPLRVSRTLGPERLWGPAEPATDRAIDHRTNSTIELLAPRFGATDALLLYAPSHAARMRGDRARGVTGWFLGMDGGGRAVAGSLLELDAAVVAAVFRDPTLEGDEALEAAVAERFGLEPDDAALLAEALAGTGRALSLATSPHGVPLADVDLGTPASLPLAWEDPSRFDALWAERVADVAAGNDRAQLQGNQWVEEGRALVARAQLVVNQLALAPADAELLRSSLLSLELAVRSWGRLALADLALRGLDGGSTADPARIRGWLAADAAELVTVAELADVALASGQVSSLAPVVPDNLRAVAQQITAVAAGAPPSARGFPVLTALSSRASVGRLDWTWNVDPAGPGWVELGETWPSYPDTSDRGEEDATSWEAWRTGVPVDTRITWRACTETPDGVTVCSSDHEAWTLQ